ncbi:DUF2336 domain-containing protein [Pararhizobium arenae]|uniref:DUF2336 domain-containing protein n=1 Tax=Pararhizobium arenae TaxID=1856850 RepID=UPI00094B2024|nr:DUF2336 domain-containing protein [Pararhizobium arenae]
MSERFRELESPGIGRRKDIVLLATVTSFESLRHPRKSDLHQFAELFMPLFEASSDEARRQAAAALSRCANVPASVALQIGSAPIGIAAIFLTRAPAIDDATLLQIINTRSPAHATAIARRENLSVKLVDALVDRRQSSIPMARRPGPAQAKAGAPSEQMSVPEMPRPDEERVQREERLRTELKALARRQTAPADTEIVIEPISELNAALLVRFARLAEIYLFASTLTSAMSSSPDLAERMLLDVSGHQLAVALTALDMPTDDLRVVLRVFYPDLDERLGGTTRSEMLIADLTPEACRKRLRHWLQLDREEHGLQPHQPYFAADRRADPRVANQTTATPQRTQRSERYLARR